MSGNIMTTKYLISSNCQKILKYLLLNSGKSCYEREIARGSGVSYGSANRLLNDLYKKRIVERKIEGKMNYYTVASSNPYLQEFKILINLLLLEPLIEKLKPYTRKIVLFGSCTTGENTQESDIDLFILTTGEDIVRSIISKYSYSPKIANKKIQAIIESPADMAKTAKESKVFIEQVKKGKILWESEINEDYL
ncbi:MAG: nucleotidyltransferase domain-containing protein [Candidatus Omnitrophota bacterium]